MLEILTSDAIQLRHGFFTRKGGASSGIFAGLNCGPGSTDQSEMVSINRGVLKGIVNSLYFEYRGEPSVAGPWIRTGRKPGLDNGRGRACDNHWESP